jgi:hypothetical protein
VFLAFQPATAASHRSRRGRGGASLEAAADRYQVRDIDAAYAEYRDRDLVMKLPPKAPVPAQSWALRSGL